MLVYNHTDDTLTREIKLKIDQNWKIGTLKQFIYEKVFRDDGKDNKVENTDLLLVEEEEDEKIIARLNETFTTNISTPIRLINRHCSYGKNIKEFCIDRDKVITVCPGTDKTMFVEMTPEENRSQPNASSQFLSAVVRYHNSEDIRIILTHLNEQDNGAIVKDIKETYGDSMIICFDVRKKISELRDYIASKLGLSASSFRGQV